MSVLVLKSSHSILNLRLLQNCNSNQIRSVSVARNWTRGQKKLATAIGLITGGIGTLIYTLDQSVLASIEGLHPPKYPWYNRGIFNSFDHASIRRGYEVYKQVCSACHSLQYVAFRNLIDVSHTEQEAKAEAADFQIEDGPDDEGNMFMRPGKLTDYFPSPYKNEQVARAANNGALPPDLTYAVLRTFSEENYIFSLLTGYCDPPAGITIFEGQHYNVYFRGGTIAMAQALYDDVIEYSDGTPAYASQLAKDVSTFLSWCAQPELETRKLYLIKSIILFFGFGFFFLYMKRHVWSVLKSRKIVFKPPNYKK